jgi:hypothetical protein
MAGDDQLALDLTSDRFEHGVRQQFWKLVERVGSKVYMRMFAPDERSYVLELDCADYGAEPIRGRFVDEKTRQCVTEAWPRGNATFEGWVKYAPGNFFICWQQDRGGLQHHPDWRPLQAWKKPNQVVNYLDFVCKLLHRPAMGYTRATQTTD